MLRDEEKRTPNSCQPSSPPRKHPLSVVYLTLVLIAIIAFWLVVAGLFFRACPKAGI